MVVHFINRFRRCSFGKKILGYRVSASKKRLERCCIRGARRTRWIGNEVVFNRTRKRWAGWGERDRIFSKDDSLLGSTSKLEVRSGG